MLEAASASLSLLSLVRTITVVRPISTRSTSAGFQPPPAPPPPLRRLERRSAAARPPSGVGGGRDSAAPPPDSRGASSAGAVAGGLWVLAVSAWSSPPQPNPHASGN